MKKMRKFLELSAKISEKLAVKSCGASSAYDYHQPKMPKALRDLKK